MPKSIQIPESRVEDISDPFNVLPLVEALYRLGKLVEEYDHELYSQYEDTEPKYRGIKLEQGLEAQSIIIGAGFVAAQAILESTFSNVKELAEVEVVRTTKGANIPNEKNKLFQIATYDRKGVPDIYGINAVANYFKHASVWPSDWDTLKNNELKTSQTVRLLGLSPGDPDNLLKGAESLGFGRPDGLLKLAKRVQKWRESLVEELKLRLTQVNLLER